LNCIPTGGIEGLEGSGSAQVAKRYSLREIIDATNNFEKILGEGGFACVYYGKLADGKEVAVKKLTLNILHEEDSQFFNEVRLLSQVHHKNLVSLVGYCQESGEQILIYEYMSNGTIRESLYGTPKAKSDPLDWRTRLNIALNSAQGLEYLHTGCPRPIIHRDVKTSNILLSDKMVAKVADFGLSKMTMEDDASHISTVVKGTAGYLDPEYYTKQQLTDKSDVFSFGIVLLELICGRPPINKLLHDENQWNIGHWVRPYLQSGDIHAIIDKALNNDFKLESMWKVIETAMLSIEPTNANRPTMQEVVCDLKEAIKIEEKAKSLNVSYDTFDDSSNQQFPNVIFKPLKVGSNSPSFSNMSKSSKLFPR
jgi:serine/threonine protein kinase